MTELELWLIPAGFFLVLLAFLAGATGQRHNLRRMTGMTISEIVADVRAAVQGRFEQAAHELDAAKSEIARLAPFEARVAELVAEGEAKAQEIAAKAQELQEAEAALTELHNLVHPAG
jgi:cellobiose-specific phosphotransferase system component IIA